MERVTNFLRGNVRIRVRCRYPERFINICAKSGVEFWDMEREEDDLVLTTHYEITDSSADGRCSGTTG
jgi:hypothetical protein